MDMGFSREHAMEALLNTSTMEQATEYLLTHPPPLLGGAVRVSFIHKNTHTQYFSPLQCLRETWVANIVALIPSRI